MIAAVVYYLVLFLTIAIILRALVSWIPNLDPRNPIVEFLYTITEPILAPIRSLLPSMGIDFSPLIAILLLQFIGNVVIQRLA